MSVKLEVLFILSLFLHTAPCFLFFVLFYLLQLLYCWMCVAAVAATLAMAQNKISHHVRQ